MASIATTIDWVYSSYPNTGVWSNNFNGMILAGNVNVIESSGYVKRNCRTKLKFTVPSNIEIETCSKLILKSSTKSTSFPYPMKACLGTNDVSAIGDVLNDAGNEVVASNVGALAYSYIYTDEACTTRFSSSSWTDDVVTYYIGFDLSNITLTPGTSYYIYIYRTVSSLDSSCVIYGAGTYGASQATNIAQHSLTLIYTPVTYYTVTVNKGTGISSVSGGGSYKNGSSATISAVPSTGYTWSKWSGDSTSTSNPLTVTVNENKSYTANATINTYTITYNKGSYGSGSNATATKTYGTNLTLKDAIFTRTGYTQTGWASNAAGTTWAYDLSGAYTSNSAATLYPYWTPNSYILTFNANGGVNTSGGNFALTNPATGYGATESWVTVTYNSSNFSSMNGNNPTRTGYEFLGWYTAATGGTQIYNTSGTSTNNGTYWNTSGLWNSTSNQTIYAQWKPLAIMSVKVNDSYKTGRPYVKVNGEWKQGIAVYVKVNGEWKISII